MASRKENAAAMPAVQRPLASAAGGVASKREPRKVRLPSLGPGAGRRPLGTLGGTAVESASASAGGTVAGASHNDEPTLATQQTLHTHSSGSTRSTATSGSSSTLRGGNPHISTRPPITEGERTSDSLSSLISTSTISQRVLRYGETVESLFCLPDNERGRRGEVCREICAGGRAGDAEAWREALMGSLAANEGAEAELGKRLIHVHRRATSRFKLSSQKDAPSRSDVLQIWLLYGMVLLQFGEGTGTSDCKQTLKHVQRLCFGRKGKEFYRVIANGAEVAEVEGAVEALRRALERGESIVELVKGRVGRLEADGLLEAGSAGGAGGGSIEGPAPVRQISLPSLGARRAKAAKGDDDDQSCASSKQGAKRPLEVDSSTLQQEQTAKMSVREKLEARKRAKTERTTPHPYKTRKRDSGASSRKGGLSAILSQTMDVGDDSDDSEEDNNQCVVPKRSADSGVTAKRSAGSEGGGGELFQDISPIDTEPTTSIMDMDMGYLLNWDPTKRGDAPRKKVTIAEDAKGPETEDRSAVQKITRNDLGYMMNWDPFGDNGGSKKKDGETDASGGDAKAGAAVRRSAAQGIGRGNEMSTIAEEATEGSDASGASQSRESASSKESKGKNRSGSSKENGPTNEGQSRESGESTISASDVDRSFLPLIENKNIIRVDDEPYAKLGIIGKGGSCKVYRALSRGCDVVALKKVKLDGLNKASIDGYANEIALLKRLKGNPAIIQLYSAEVDLERKSILLVMEVGEVDLHSVLRQQELLSSKQGKGAGRSSLNMNFIRLTWQQMLTAVHSIHEERIIHSDLKPANFLFVRGALKLIDFGIAKAIEREDTTNVYRETLSGTLSYMSPEAIMDTSTNAKGVRVNKCGRPSDIWSLGCILYQMVYGKTPFADCHGIPQKVLAITSVNHEIRFPADGVDESAIDAMKACLERNPKHRPPIVGKDGLLNEHCFLHSAKSSNSRR